MSKKAIIIGAGPAGLTAAYELLKYTDIKPIILELTNTVGGISKTVNYKGNCIDIGGHRFFSKSDVVMSWWQDMMPVESEEDEIVINYQNKTNTFKPIRSEDHKDDVFLIRKRVSHILFMRRLFEYPLKLSITTLKKFGLLRTISIGFSYIRYKLFPIKQEKNLEDFFINRFGKKLYLIFFKDYTEKVWGVPCDQISSEWGKQRIKGLDIIKTLKHALKKSSKEKEGIAQKNTETSLIERFMYPKYGPGQLWEVVAAKIRDLGGEIHFNQRVISLDVNNFQISSITAIDSTAKEQVYETDYVISTMPVRYLIKGLQTNVPQKVSKVADQLLYRDFITVGLLLNDLKLKNNGLIVEDNWIYIQESDVKLGRLQIFNNWSPYMVHDRDKVWIGLEYFCNQGDELWEMTDGDFIKFAIKELESIDIIDSNDVVDHTLIRMPKTYPSYFGAYKDFDIVKDYVDQFSNLFLVGRNGMHKYNNQDHSMLTAMTAVQNIKNNIVDKSNIWAINTEQEYHEETSSNK